MLEDTNSLDGAHLFFQGGKSSSSKRDAGSAGVKRTSSITASSAGSSTSTKGKFTFNMLYIYTNIGFNPFVFF